MDYLPKCAPPIVEEPAEPVELTDIKVDIENECLKALVNSILAKDIEFKTAQTIKGIFDANNKINLRFVEGDFNAPYQNADAGTLITKISFDNTGTIVTQLDIRINLNKNT